MKKGLVAFLTVIFLIVGCVDKETGGNGNGNEPTEDTTPPHVNITYPHNGQTIYSYTTIDIKADAFDNDEIEKVNFKVIYGYSGTTQTEGTDYTEPYMYEGWRAPFHQSPYDYQIRATAYDISGNTNEDEITINVYWVGD